MAPRVVLSALCYTAEGARRADLAAEISHPAPAWGRIAFGFASARPATRATRAAAAACRALAAGDIDRACRALADGAA